VAQVPAAALRTRDGACVTLDMDAVITIKSCLEIGSPGTLDDDGTTPVLVSVVHSKSISLADPNGYQITVRVNGVEALKTMGREDVPSVGSGYLPFYAVDIQKLPSAPTTGQVVEIEWIAAWDTAIKKTGTITLL
jgi:hypothetical protein